MAIIDADSHMFEQPGLWRDHLPADHRHLALGLEEDDLGYTWLTHKASLCSSATSASQASSGSPMDCRTGASARASRRSRRYTEMPATYRDPAARRDALDGWGIDEQVIFPNWGLNFGWYLQGDVESELANISAWNRWACEVREEGRGRLAAGWALLVARRS